MRAAAAAASYLCVLPLLLLLAGAHAAGRHLACRWPVLPPGRVWHALLCLPTTSCKTSNLSHQSRPCLLLTVA